MKMEDNTDALAALNRLAAYSYPMSLEGHGDSEADYIIVRDALASRPTAMPESGEAGMLPDTLGPVAKEWYLLCERARHVHRIGISGDLAEAIVKTVCALASPPAKPACDLLALCQTIVRDAVPATDSGATCFVPRYQIDRLGVLLAGVDTNSEL